MNGELEIGEEEEDALLDRKSMKRKAEKRAKVETPMPTSKDRKRRREEDDSNVVKVGVVTAGSKHASSRTALQPIDNTSEWRRFLSWQRTHSAASPRPI